MGIILMIWMWMWIWIDTICIRLSFAVYFSHLSPIDLASILHYSLYLFGISWFVVSAQIVS